MNFDPPDKSLILKTLAMIAINSNRAFFTTLLSFTTILAVLRRLQAFLSCKSRNPGSKCPFLRQKMIKNSKFSKFCFLVLNDPKYPSKSFQEVFRPEKQLSVHLSPFLGNMTKLDFWGQGWSGMTNFDPWSNGSEFFVHAFHGTIESTLNFFKTLK